MKKINSFFKLIKYELKRVARNKMVLSMLLGFSILLMLIVSFVDVGAKNLPVGIYTGGMEINQIGVLDVIDEEFDKDKLIKVKSEKEGIEKVNKGELCFFIKINTIEIKNQRTVASRAGKQQLPHQNATVQSLNLYKTCLFQNNITDRPKPQADAYTSDSTENNIHQGCV